MKVYILTVIIIGQAGMALAQKAKTLSFINPPVELEIFGKGMISTSMNERDFTISPDGVEIYYTISTPRSTFQTIVSSRKNKRGEWSAPEVVSFAGSYSDLEPALSSDGNTLFFASNRPLSGTEPKDFDIWKVTRNGNTWGEPVNLGSIINTTSDEFYPSITNSGNLYFTASYQGGPGREDIYVASFQNGQFQKPLSMDTAINTKYYEFNAFVSPDEKFIIFTSYGRKDDAGGGDLYMSVKDSSGKWTSSKNLKELNSKQLDYCPYVSPDGKILFITSERHQLPVYFPSKASYKNIYEITIDAVNGTGNIYWIDFQRFIK